MLKNLKEFIGNFQAFDTETLQFHLPDHRMLAEKIELKKRSHDLGVSNLPKPDDKKKDFLAEEIDGYLFTVIRQAKEKVGLHIASHQDMHKESLISGGDNDEHIIFKERMNALHETGKLAVIELFTKKRNLINIEKFFKIFRDKNQLIRPAIYPKNMVLAWGIIFLFAIIETLVNAFTLQDVHPEGFAGVLTETFGITLINIFLAIFAGIFLRYKNHIDNKKKVFGYLTPIIILTFIIFLNLFFGHYRDALSFIGNSMESFSVESIYQQYAVLGSKTIENLMTSPLSLNDFKSYLLFIIGTAMGLLAMYKSYNNDDIYPEYGKYDKELTNITDSYHSFIQEIYDEMSEIVEEGIKKLSGSWTYRTQALSQANASIDRLKTLKSNYEMWFANMNSVGNSLYGEYRAENLKVRTDGRTPKCFDVSFTIPKEAAVDFPNTRKKTTKLSPIDKRAEKLQDALKTYMDHFKAIENLSPDEIELKEFDFKETKIDNIISKFKA